MRKASSGRSVEPPSHIDTAVLDQRGCPGHGSGSTGIERLVTIRFSVEGETPSRTDKSRARRVADRCPLRDAPNTSSGAERTGATPMVVADIGRNEPYEPPVAQGDAGSTSGAAAAYRVTGLDTSAMLGSSRHAESAVRWVMARTSSRRWKGCRLCKPHKHAGCGDAIRKPRSETRWLGRSRRLARHDLGDHGDS